MAPGRPPTRPLTTLAVTLATLTIGLSACTSSTTGRGGSSGSGATSGPTGTSAVSVPATPTETVTETTTVPAPTISTSAVPSTSVPAPTLQVPKGTCTISQLTVRVLRGSAAQQQEFALITFTNSSAVPCTMFGFPGVSLRRGNALLGQPAEHSADQPANVRLVGGAMAQAMVTDYSSCQAPLSDTVRVYPPNLTQFTDRPLEIRGCRIVVTPVSPA